MRLNNAITLSCLVCNIVYVHK